MRAVRSVRSLHDAHEPAFQGDHPHPLLRLQSQVAQRPETLRFKYLKIRNGTIFIPRLKLEKQ